MAEEVEDLVAALVRLVGQVGPDQGVHGLTAALEGLGQVGALVAELELVEGEHGHGRGAEGSANVLDAGRVGRAELLVAVQQADLLAGAARDGFVT